MKFEYDPEADAAYVQIVEGEIAETREIADDLYLDVDAKGNVLGIEILSVRARGDGPLDARPDPAGPCRRPETRAPGGSLLRRGPPGAGSPEGGPAPLRGDTGHCTPLRSGTRQAFRSACGGGLSTAGGFRPAQAGCSGILRRHGVLPGTPAHDRGQDMSVKRA